MVSLTYSIFMLSAGVVSITAGRLADRFSPRLIFLAGSIIHSLGILLASWTTSLLHLYLFYGVMAGIGNTPMNIIATMVAAQLGMADGGLVAGLLYDLSGNYPSSWILSVVSGLVTAFVAMDLKAPSRAAAATERASFQCLSSTTAVPLETPPPNADRASALLR
jgi:MFS family permease